MSFLKKIVSRSRSNSNSYVDEDYDRNVQSPGADGQRGYDPNRPPSSWKYDNPQHTPPPGQSLDGAGSGPNPSERQSGMYGSQGPIANQGVPYQSSARNSGMMTGRSSRDGFVDVPAMSQQLPPNVAGNQSGKVEHSAAPDLLTRAFNEAVRPYSEKIENLEDEIRNLQAFVDQLEQQRMDVFAWIDKRGLRPDVPPSVAKQMDSMPSSSNGTSAAEALNSQLDRKITIVNFDLHRLQDDLNDSISSAHFASSMAKFLPDIQRLASLQGGPKAAYDLIIKLVGNLNSHGGVEARDAGPGQAPTQAEIDEDHHARADFYERMDDELIDIIRRRLGEHDDWDTQKEVRRFERNAAFLKNIGIESYFPRSLEVLKTEGGRGGMSGGYGSGPGQQGAYGGSGGPTQGGYAGNGNSIGVGGMQSGTASPPRYK